MKQIVKKREINVVGIPSPEYERKLQDAILRLNGVKRVETGEKKAIHVEYDLMKVRLEEIEETIKSLGYQIRSGLFGKIKRALLYDSERNEYDNVRTPNSPCCSDPKLR